MRDFYEKKLKSELIDIILECRKEIARLRKIKKYSRCGCPVPEEEE